MKTNLLQKSAMALVAALVFVPGTEAATVVNALDLTDNGLNDSGFVFSDVGGTAFVTLNAERVAGTGNYDPFLKLQQAGNDNTEQAYNTDGRIGADAPFDGENTNVWNHSIRVSDLQVTVLPNADGILTRYVGFELDAHEPTGGNQKILSIDNIRIYTARASDGGDATTLNIDDLGVLRYALNDPNVPVMTGVEPENWVKMDSSSNTYNSGSGESDLVFYVPVDAFFAPGQEALLADDYVYFYNLNGVHFAADPDLAAQSTPEEWRIRPGTPGTPGLFNNPVPDGGATALLLGLGLFGVGMLARTRFIKA